MSGSQSHQLQLSSLSARYSPCINSFSFLPSFDYLLLIHGWKWIWHFTVFKQWAGGWFHPFSLPQLVFDRLIFVVFVLFLFSLIARGQVCISGTPLFFSGNCIINMEGNMGTHTSQWVSEFIERHGMEGIILFNLFLFVGWVDFGLDIGYWTLGFSFVFWFSIFDIFFLISSVCFVYFLSFPPCFLVFLLVFSTIFVHLKAALVIAFTWRNFLGIEIETAFVRQSILVSFSLHCLFPNFLGLKLLGQVHTLSGKIHSPWSIARGRWSHPTSPPISEG